jgi:hypothetical protein
MRYGKWTDTVWHIAVVNTIQQSVSGAALRLHRRHTTRHASPQQSCSIAYFATGIVNSAPFAMLSGQRCMMLL